MRRRFRPRRAGGVGRDGDEEIERFPRNVFLELSTLGIGAAIGGLVTLPVIVMAVGDPFVKDFNPRSTSARSRTFRRVSS